MELIRKSRNILLCKDSYKTRTNTTKKIYLLSDLHWDNPKCKRDLLKAHLDKAIEDDAIILFNGDVFCLMQGKYDPRKQKADIRPEHNVTGYLDAIIDDASEWFKPYAKHIHLVGYGNHETNIINRMETDVLGRFVERLNTKADSNIQTGGYGGWYIYNVSRDGSNNKPLYIKYFHGSGGGAPVTKGTIQHNRRSTFTEGADVIWMGHTHTDYEVTYSREFINNRYEVQKKKVLMVRTATYKDEYDDNAFGWANEKGFSPTPLGGRILEINTSFKDNGVQQDYKTYSV